MNMKNYEKPVVEIICIDADVITGSCDTKMPDFCIDGDD